MAVNLNIQGNFIVLSDNGTSSEFFRIPRANTRYLHTIEGGVDFFEFLPIRVDRKINPEASQNLKINFTDLIDNRTGVTFTDTDELNEFLSLNLGAQLNPVQVLKYTGWVFYADATYTSAAPRTINNTRAQVTIDGLRADTDTTQEPADAVNPIWDTTNNKIAPIALDDAYSLRFSFVAEMVKNSYFSIELDIGDGSIIDIGGESKIYPRTTDEPTRFSFDVPIFCKSTFLANGGKIYIDNTDDGSSMDAYDFEILLVRTHKAD